VPRRSIEAVPAMKRRHDLDALRAGAMLLGVLLHAVFYAIPFRYFLSYVPPGGPNAWALPYFHLVQVIHGFRMPLFFLLSGFFTALLWQRRGLGGLLQNRILRIALPLVLGVLTIRNFLYVNVLLEYGIDVTSAEWLEALLNDLGHLWFLWQLLLLCGLFLLLAGLGLRFRHPLWWLLVPASFVPMALMKQDFLLFGPETSTAVAVEAPVLAFYAAFFLFGVFFHQRGFEVRRWWMIAILPSLGLLYPAAAPLLFVHERFREATQLQAALLEVAFAWLMCCGLMGLFRSIASRERPWLRRVSDASYWIYLMHQPLMEILSDPVQQRVPGPHLHFLLLVLGSTGILYFAWIREVRFSWVGTLLNGRRERPGAALNQAGYHPAMQGGG